MSEQKNECSHLYFVKIETAAHQENNAMPKGSPELTNARREEIIAACEVLYQKLGFKEVTIKEIAQYTYM